jgi:phosphoribosylformimino-5-aminoimidazole carboxamide ribotide isomerase
VRLFQGDYQKETIFDEDPLKVALRWQTMGARRIHMVDLDGAAAGESVNYEIIKSIAATIQAPTQLGGGMRTQETITRMLKAGVKRIILGTIAVENPELVKDIQRFNHYEYRCQGRHGSHTRVAEEYRIEGH